MSTSRYLLVLCMAILLSIISHGCLDEADFPECIDFPAEGGTVHVHALYADYRIVVEEHGMTDEIITGENSTISHEWLTISHESDENTYVFTAGPNQGRKSRSILVNVFSGSGSMKTRVRQAGL